MQGDIVSQGAELMVYGMGTVVVFLTLLVLMTTLMSAVLGRYFAEPAPAPVEASKAVGGQSPSPETVAAITAAIHQHRQR